MKTLFIINPVSGKGRPRIHERIRNYIHHYLGEAGVPFEIRVWERPDMIGELIEYAHVAGFEVVVAVGGDGTINEIAKRLVGTQIALGVIPIGSGNGFARHVGISTKPRRAVRQLVGARVVKADSGDFGGIPFTNNAGIGIDAEVAKRFSRAGKRGLPTYVKMAIRLLLKFRAFDCQLEVDGKSYEFRKLMFMDISNGTQWGGGAKIAPLSKITDGYFEAILVERSNIFEMSRMVGMMFDGTLHRHKSVKIIRGKHFKITRATPGNAHVDGEAVKLGRTIECNIREQSLNLLVPVKKKRNGKPRVAVAEAVV